MKAVKKYNDGGKKPKRRKVVKGGFDIEIDGETYVVDAKMVETIRRDGTVKKRKFKTKPRYDEAPSAPARIKDVTRFPKQ